jgi:hypothetical protein
MAGERLGPLLGPLAALGFEPSRRGEVPAGSRRAGKTTVGDLADQTVREPVRLQTGERGLPRFEQSTVHEVLETVTDLVPVATVQALERPGPHLVAEHGRIERE